MQMLDIEYDIITINTENVCVGPNNNSIVQLNCPIMTAQSVESGLSGQQHTSRPKANKGFPLQRPVFVRRAQKIRPREKQQRSPLQSERRSVSVV